MSSRYWSSAAPNSPIRAPPAAPLLPWPAAAKGGGPHQSRDEPQDGDDDQELDEREAALIPQEPARRRASHRGTSVTGGEGLRVVAPGSSRSEKPRGSRRNRLVGARLTAAHP